jgi:hypothetical protein
MADRSPPMYTHFDMMREELPAPYYEAIGRALYRWSQLEGTICVLATSIKAAIWLDAIRELRRSGGFQLSRVLKLLKEEAGTREGSEPVLQDLARAEGLFASRKILYHSVWGRVTGPGRAAVGIQEWSADAYDNFRPVELPELETFAAECAATSDSLMKNAILLFHGHTSVVVNDDDGLTKPGNTA